MVGGGAPNVYRHENLILQIILGWDNGKRQLASICVFASGGVLHRTTTSLSYTRGYILCVSVARWGDNSHYVWRACALANGIISHMRALWRWRDIPSRDGWGTAEYIQEKGENSTWHKHNIKVPSRKCIYSHTHTYTHTISLTYILLNIMYQKELINIINYEIIRK